MNGDGIVSPLGKKIVETVDSNNIHITYKLSQNIGQD